MTATVEDAVDELFALSSPSDSSWREDLKEKMGLFVGDERKLFNQLVNQRKENLLKMSQSITSRRKISDTSDVKETPKEAVDDLFALSSPNDSSWKEEYKSKLDQFVGVERSEFLELVNKRKEDYISLTTKKNSTPSQPAENTITPNFLPPHIQTYINTKKCKVIQILGDGTNVYGQLFLIEQPPKKIPLVLKVIRAGDFVKAEYDEAMKLRHLNIMRTHEMVEIGDFVFLTTEFAEEGTIDKWIEKEKNEKREPSVIVARTMICQMLSAVAYMHEMGLLHRDLKTANILIDTLPSPLLQNLARLTLKLCDFGTTRRISSFTSSSSTSPSNLILNSTLTYRAGTPLYWPPEILLTPEGTPLRYTVKADSWSLGVIFYELLSYTYPFAKDNLTISIMTPIKLPNSLKTSITTVGVTTDEKRNCEEVLRGLLETDPLKRLTCKMALEKLEGKTVNIF